MGTLGFERGISTVGQQIGFQSELDEMHRASRRANGDRRRPGAARAARGGVDRARVISATTRCAPSPTGRGAAAASVVPRSTGPPGTASSVSSRWTCSGPRRRSARAFPYELGALQRLFLFTRAETIYGGSEPDPAQHHRRARARAAARAAEADGHHALPASDSRRRHGLLARQDRGGHGRGRYGDRFGRAKRCLEEGARVLISDQHERRLAEASEALASARTRAAGAALRRDRRGPGAGADRGRDPRARPHRRADQQRRARRHAPVVEMRDEQWFKVLDVTLTWCSG